MTVQIIDKLFPIEKADKIETATLVGMSWQVIVRKGEFVPGEKVYYVEIDNLVPDKYLTGTPKGSKDRLKTIKLRGQISQGLIIALPEELKSKDVGTNLDEYFEIEKYSKDTPQSNLRSVGRFGRKPNSSFPNFLVRTDEVRIQSAPNLLTMLEGKPYYITVKLDGTSFTAYKYQGEYGVCSRNRKLKVSTKWTRFISKVKTFFHIENRKDYLTKEDSKYLDIANKLNLEEILPEGYAIQGELCGPSIQGNKLGLKENRLFVFNVVNITGNKRLSYEEMAAFCVGYGLAYVPVIDWGETFPDFTVEEILKFAEGKYDSGQEREGIVVRSQDQSISFKVISNKFLLKNGE